jgi:hypothetical protein
MRDERELIKYGLKVLGFEIVSGRASLENIKENDERRYFLYGEVNLIITTNQGTLHVVTAPGFIFDGRSGPKIIDWYAPNLGTLEERLAWFVHDCNGYGLDLSFEDTNVLLFAMLRDLAKYRTAKASVIQLAVSLSSSWYGEPKDGDWCKCNVGKVRTCWIPKEAV